MVNYKAIADAIPQAEFDAAVVELSKEYTHQDRETGEDEITTGKFMDLTTVTAAFNVIKDLTQIVSRGNSPQTYESISRASSFSVAAKLESVVKLAVAAGDLSAWVDSAFNGAGININDPKFKNKMIALKPKYGIDDAFLLAMRDAGKITSLKFNGLKPGHVQNALQKRHAGVI